VNARYDHLCNYLDVLTAGAGPGELIGLRYRRLDDRDAFGRYFEPVGSAHALATRALILARTTDTYIACAPRLRRGGTLGDVAASAVVWADLDTPEAVERLQFSPAPAVVIASGTDTNMHAYWPLTDRASAQDLASANRKLAHTLAGDGGSVTNPAGNLPRRARATTSTSPPATSKHSSSNPVGAANGPFSRPRSYDAMPQSDNRMRRHATRAHGRA